MSEKRAAPDNTMRHITGALEAEAASAPDYTRKEVNVAAARLAESLRRFMVDGDQFISLSRRFALTSAALELEALADGR